jgi:hypothetical protein
VYRGRRSPRQTSPRHPDFFGMTCQESAALLNDGAAVHVNIVRPIGPVRTGPQTKTTIARDERIQECAARHFNG